MPEEKHTQSQSISDLTKIYRFNKDITGSRTRILLMMYNEQERGAAVDRKRCNRMEKLHLRINKLTLMRNDEIMRVYSNVKIRRSISPLTPSPTPRRVRSPSPVPIGLPSQLSVRSPSPLTLQSPSPSPSPSPGPVQPSSPTVPPFVIANIVIESDVVLIDMVLPSSKSNQDINKVDDDIIYPEGVTDFRPYQTVARYRKAIGQSTDFRLNPLLVDEDSTETLVLGLEAFAQQHGCELSFTNEDQQFDKSIYRAACGMADLGSIHLLATDSLLTANFQFEIDLDFDTKFTQSEDHIQSFVFDFCGAISKVLCCENNDVRVFSINKIADEPGKSQVNFGLTTPEAKRTEQLAHDLQNIARSGFTSDTVLKHVKPREYECTWKPVLTCLQIRASDLDARYNFDYRKPGVPKESTRGGYPYYLPISWYRHGLNVSTKYGADCTWIGQANAEGEWPVAFHGTEKKAVVGIIKEGFLISAVKTDVKKEEAIEEISEEANRPGLYVATHCNGGADIYTTPFTVTTYPDKSEQFRIVFQCRVEPGKFSTHTSPVNVGKAWRIVDPAAIRPYGILLRKEIPSKGTDEAQT